MLHSPSLIHIESVATALRCLLPHLSPACRAAVTIALEQVSEHALPLAFVEMAPAIVLIFRKGGVYEQPAECPYITSQTVPELSPLRWVAYASQPLSSMKDVSSPAAKCVLSGQAQQPDRITATLHSFHFFSDLQDSLQEITSYDATLALKLNRLHDLRAAFGEDLCGDELGLSSAVAIALASDCAVDLELVLDHDDLHPEALALPPAKVDCDGLRHVVVLGNGVEVRPCGLLRATRLS
jgi:hypothetical protein